MLGISVYALTQKNGLTEIFIFSYSFDHFSNSEMK